MSDRHDRVLSSVSGLSPVLVGGTDTRRYGTFTPGPLIVGPFGDLGPTVAIGREVEAEPQLSVGETLSSAVGWSGRGHRQWTGKAPGSMRPAAASSRQGVTVLILSTLPAGLTGPTPPAPKRCSSCRLVSTVARVPIVTRRRGGGRRVHSVSAWSPAHIPRAMSAPDVPPTEAKSTHAFRKANAFPAAPAMSKS